MNKYYCQLNLVLIWLLELTLFRTYVYSLPVVIKKCLNPLTLRKFIQLFPNSIKKFLVTFMKKTIPGFESRKEIGLFLFGGQQVSPFLSSSHDPCQIVAKLSTPRASLSNSKKTARGIYFTNCYTLGQTTDSPAGMFLVFSRYKTILLTCQGHAHTHWQGKPQL